MMSKSASTKKIFFIIIAIIFIVAVYFLLDKFNITGRAILNSENVTLNNESAIQINQTTADVNAPSVVSVSPARDESSVSIARLILVNFDEEINSSTINTQTFKLMLNGNVIPGDIEYKDRVATLTPASTLLNGRAYSVILTTGIKDLAGNALTSDYSWNFTTVTAGAGGGGAGGSGGGSSGGTTPDTTVPTIGATTIPSNSANAAINKGISVTFSEPMDSSTINSQTFIVNKEVISSSASIPDSLLNVRSSSRALIVVNGTVSYANQTATFTPVNNFDYNSTYFVTLTTGIKDLAGNPLAGNYTLNFTTLKPTLQPQTPRFEGREGNDILVYSWIAAPRGCLALQSVSSVPAKESDWKNTLYEVSYNNGVNKVSINTSVIGIQFFRLAQVSAPCDISVPRIVSTNPANGSVNIPISAHILVTFSELMDTSTFDSQDFILTNGSSVVQGIFSSNGNTMSFAPLENLSYDSVYFVTLTTGIKDAAGNSLANNYTWSFKTTALSIQPQNPRFEGLKDGILTYSWIAAPKGCLALQSVSSVPAKESDWKNTLYEVSYNNGVNKVSINTSVIGIQFFRLAQVSAPCDISVPRIVSTNPANDALDVPIDIILSVVFDEDMDASSVMNHFVLKKEGVIIAGTANYANKVISFKPNLNLSLNTTYTAMIASDAKDISGNGLAGNYTWNFRTVKN